MGRADRDVEMPMTRVPHPVPTLTGCGRKGSLTQVASDCLRIINAFKRYRARSNHKKKGWVSASLGERCIEVREG